MIYWSSAQTNVTCPFLLYLLYLRSVLSKYMPKILTFLQAVEAVTYAVVDSLGVTTGTPTTLSTKSAIKRHSWKHSCFFSWTGTCTCEVLVIQANALMLNLVSILALTLQLSTRWPRHSLHLCINDVISAETSQSSVNYHQKQVLPLCLNGLMFPCNCT